MMLSKVCSDQNKPNGQFFLPAIVEDVTQFVKTLPIRKVLFSLFSGGDRGGFTFGQ